MNYPLISEYVEAIKAAEDNFDQLNNLRPVLGEDGKPVMTSGGFAVVFKMEDEQTGKMYAVKCFLREQEGRAEAYHLIAEELEYVSSTFLTPIKYLDKELFVDTNASDETEFPVLLMDWVDGVTLDNYIRENIYDEYTLSMLAYQFSRLAMWLMPQPFAHGDLKPDNILVRDDGTLVLVDYDGMYVPAMKGQKARELGSPDFRHPNRNETDFDEHIDDFSLISILLSLKAISLNPELLEQYGASDRLLFSEKDYREFSQCELFKVIFPSKNKELNIIYSMFLLSHSGLKLTKQNIESLQVMENNLYKIAKAYCRGPEWASFLHYEDISVEKDKDKAFHIFKDLAKGGSVDAQCCTGCLAWEKGNEKEALYWYKLAANNGDERAVSHIRRNAEKLYNVKRYNKAFDLFKISAEYGDENAIMMLAFSYANGLGTNIDIYQAQLWYGKIKDGKSAYLIGKKYFEGKEIDSDYPRAIYWFRKAIDMNESSAYPYLAVCCEIGLGTEKNQELSQYYFDKADKDNFCDIVNYFYEISNYNYCLLLLKTWRTKLEDEGFQKSVENMSRSHRRYNFYKERLAENGFRID